MSEVEGLTEGAEEHIHHAAHSGPQWASWVALSTVILAVLAALSAFLSGFNETEALINRQLASDQWSYYQAKGLKGNTAKEAADIFAAIAELPHAPKAEKAEKTEKTEKPADKPAAPGEKASGAGAGAEKGTKHLSLEEQIQFFKEEQTRYKEDQAEIKEKATEFEKESDAALRNHETYSKGVILFQISIAVSAVSVLTKKRRYWVVSLVFGAGGLLFLLLGLLKQWGPVLFGHGH